MNIPSGLLVVYRYLNQPIKVTNLNLAFSESDWTIWNTHHKKFKLASAQVGQLRVRAEQGEDFWCHIFQLILRLVALLVDQPEMYSSRVVPAVSPSYHLSRYLRSQYSTKQVIVMEMQPANSAATHIFPCKAPPSLLHSGSVPREAAQD